MQNEGYWNDVTQNITPEHVLQKFLRWKIKHTYILTLRKLIYPLLPLNAQW